MRSRETTPPPQVYKPQSNEHGASNNVPKLSVISALSVCPLEAERAFQEKWDLQALATDGLSQPEISALSPCHKARLAALRPSASQQLVGPSAPAPADLKSKDYAALCTMRDACANAVRNAQISLLSASRAAQAARLQPETLWSEMLAPLVAGLSQCQQSWGALQQSCSEELNIRESWLSSNYRQDVARVCGATSFSMDYVQFVDLENECATLRNTLGVRRSKLQEYLAIEQWATTAAGPEGVSDSSFSARLQDASNDVTAAYYHCVQRFSELDAELHARSPGFPPDMFI